MYPSDFEAADAVFTPTQDELFLGLPPLLALILFLLLLALAAGMFFLGRWHAEQSGGGDSDRAPEEIYKVIRRYAGDARSAGSNDLKSKAETLERKIEEYLGPLLVIGRELAGLTKALKTAGDGKIEEPTKPDHKAEAKPEQPKTCVCGGSGTPQGCTCAPQSLSINQIYIGGSPVIAPPTHGPHGPHDPPARSEDKPAPPKTRRDMTHQEQIDALDKAVRAFNDYWLNKDGRVSELRAAQRALNRRPSSSDLSGPAGHHFGNRH